MSSFEEKVAEVISGLNEDYDFVEAVKDNIDLKPFVKEAIEKNEQVRKALVGLLIDFINNLDLSDYNVTNQMSDVVADLIRNNDEITKAAEEKAKQLAKDEIESWDSESDVAGTIRDQLEIPGDKISKLCDKDPDIQKKLQEKTKELAMQEINSWGSGDQDSDELSALMEPIRNNLTISKNLAQQTIQDPEIQKAFEEKVRKLVTTTIENLAEEKENMVQELISKNETLNRIISEVIDETARSKDTENVIRNAILHTIKTNINLENILSKGISDAISTKIADGILKISFGIRP